MEGTHPIDAELDIGPVFGELTPDVREAVLGQLRLADEQLQALLGEFGDGWSSDGLLLETLPSGQASVHGRVARDDDSLAFIAELRPADYFPEVPWRPGDPPRVMLADAWTVDGLVQVNVRRFLLNKKYWVRETAAEIAERRFEDAVEAASTLVATLTALSGLARAREPTVEAWAPAE